MVSDTSMSYPYVLSFNKDKNRKPVRNWCLLFVNICCCFLFVCFLMEQTAQRLSLDGFFLFFSEIT